MYTYRDAEKYIDKLSERGIILGLETMKNVLGNLDNPQRACKKIHIAGTNGKGSVSAFLSQILIEAGYKVGLYNSPFVNDRLEIIKVNNKQITQEEFAECIFSVQCADNKNEITAYEAETAAAFLWFKKCRCDVAIIETGLGGTYDATNIIEDKLCAVITSISYDHRKILGDTLEKIAENKAGIIRNTDFAVVSEQKAEVMKVISDKCNVEGASLVVSDFSEIKNISFENSYQQFDYKKFKGLKISLLGTFQTENAVTAIETINCLNHNKKGFDISDECVYKGLEKACHKGRFEKINDKPLFFIDGAHNEDAARRLSETVKKYFEDKKIYLIMGVFKDKEYKKIIEIMTPLAEFVYAIQPDNPRALDNKILAEEISKVNKNVCVCSIDEAVKKALQISDNQSVIIAFGSLSFLEYTRNCLRTH